MKVIYPSKIVCSAEEYHAHEAVGSSSLRTIIQRSPGHYLFDRENPSESTPAQRFGTAIHRAVLEPNLFKTMAVIEPEFAGTGSRAAKEQWHIENHGKTILKRDQYDTIQGILKSILKHSHASKLVSAGAAEESLFWKDSETGVLCKARPDFLRDGHIIVDIKSADDASYRTFQKSIANYQYHVQAAFYLDGAAAVLGKKFDEFIILAVEKSAPYAVNTFLLDEAMINEGRMLYRGALQVLKKCMEDKQYPAYPDELVSIDLPAWAYRGEQ